MDPEQPYSITDQYNGWLSFMAKNTMTGGAEAFLSFQADLLVGLETGVSEWLLRRRQALLDAKRLVIRTRNCADIDDLMHAQQDWLRSAFNRMAADTMSFQSAVIFGNQARREAQREARRGGASASAVTNIDSRRGTGGATARPPTIVGSDGE